MLDTAGLLDALAGADSAVVHAADVAALVGLDQGDADEAVEALAAEGLLDGWTNGEGPCYILSPLAAARLNLELETDGTSWRWVESGTARPEPKPPGRRRPGYRERNETDFFRASPEGAGLDGLADPKALPPDRAALEADEAERRRGRRGREWRSYEFFRPLLILGTDWTWPVPWRRGEEPCPVCGTLERLHILAYCSICHRAGIDCRLEEVKAHERPRPTTANGLSGGRGEAVPGKAPRIDPTAGKRPRGKGGRARGTGRNSFSLAAVRRRLGG